ncbi:Aldo/keto reductase family [Phytophthora infestans]|nr:Aldo/keto reductase family [Phytophthora infestans]
MELTTQGNCRGVVIEDIDDRESLLAVRGALQQMCMENTLLSRANFVAVASTPLDCSLEEITARVEQALATLQFQQLDMLLLQAQSLPAANSLYARKHAVLEAWEHMMAIQQAGLVQHIGVSDLSVQDVDFLVTAFPHNLPEAWSMKIQLPGMTALSDSDVPFEDVTAFAHSHGIDVLGRILVTNLETFEPHEEWELLMQNLTERYRERPFKFLVAYENEGSTSSYHMESHTLGNTTVMQTWLQIVVRYLLQKGLVVIPQSFDDLQHDDRDKSTQGAALREIFGPLAHPFSSLHPSCSPHKMRSSLLTRDDLVTLSRVLQLTTSFPPPKLLAQLEGVDLAPHKSDE